MDSTTSSTSSAMPRESAQNEKTSETPELLKATRPTRVRRTLTLQGIPRQNRSIQRHAKRVEVKSKNTTKCPNLVSLSYEETSAHIRQLQLCYGCLLPGHSHRRCPQPPTCGKCGKNGHNELFCGWRPQPAASAPAVAAADVPTPLVELDSSLASE